MTRIEQRPGRVQARGAGFEWPTASTPRIDAEALEAAGDLAANTAADSLLVIHQGQLIYERYWNGKTASDLQQTFSGTKSVFSLLVGRAVDHGYLTGLDQRVRDLVPEMPKHQAQLTFRNVLAMQSGMETSLEIEGLGESGLTQLEIALQRRIVTAPFERYHYNNAAYRLLFTALERASGRDLETLTEEEIFKPLGFEGACWVRLYALRGSDERFTGYQSIRMRPRDFAKSAQIIVDDGVWRGSPFLSANYVRSLITAPRPAINPSFGLFHHLNAGDFHFDLAGPRRIERQLAPGSPSDLFLQIGVDGQMVAGVPSLKLVIVRTGGPAGDSIYNADNPFARLLERVTSAFAHVHR